MPLYSYQAIDKNGKKKSGFIEADSEQGAKTKLRGQGVMVKKIVVKKGAKAKENLSRDQLIAFTMQLSQLVDAGIPVYESLLTVEEQIRTESYHRVILSLCEKIKKGSSLSDAMAEFPDSFNKLYISMIRAGEQAGALNVVLDRLSELLTKQNKLRIEIQTAMIYPSILAAFAILVIAVLLGFVVPSIEGIFAERELNTFTQIIISTSHFFRGWWWIYLPALIAFIIFTVVRLRTPEGKEWLQRTFLKVPLIKTLIVQTSIARFCRTMGTLQQGGLTMIDSLRIAREVMGNVTLEEEIKRAEAKIIEGSSLSHELKSSKWIPAMVSRMLAVGEETGNTQLMMNKIADIYEGELAKSLERIMALAQPVILITMGMVIGFVLLAILLPLTDMSSFAM